MKLADAVTARVAEPHSYWSWCHLGLKLSMAGRHAAEESDRDADAHANEMATEPFEDFLAQFEHSLFAYVWRMVGARQEADDICQEIFLRAWRHFDRIQTYERPDAWLFRVATNLTINHLRRRALTRQVSATLHTQARRWENDPASEVAERDQVRQILLELSPRQRAALILHDVHGLTSPEIGSILHVSPAAVKMLLARARERFRIRYLHEEVQS